MRRRRARLHHVPLRRWPGLLGAVLRESARDRITMVGASLAFHAFIALVPVLVAVVGLLDLVGLSAAQLHELLHTTSAVLPRQMATVIDDQLRRPPSSRVNIAEVVVGLLLALWSSVEAMAALQVALDVAYEVPHDRGLLERRAVALPLIGVTLLLGGVASVLLVLGGPIGHLLPGALLPFMTVGRYAGSLALVMLLLSAYYGFGPASAASWDWISPGSMVAAAGWVLTSLGFSFYLDHFGHESRTYGSLAGVVVTLLWMFLTCIVVLVGAELNRELERTHEASVAGRDSVAGESVIRVVGALGAGEGGSEEPQSVVWP